MNFSNHSQYNHLTQLVSKSRTIHNLTVSHNIVSEEYVCPCDQPCCVLLEDLRRALGFANVMEWSRTSLGICVKCWQDGDRYNNLVCSKCNNRIL